MSFPDRIQKPASYVISSETLPVSASQHSVYRLADCPVKTREIQSINYSTNIRQDHSSSSQLPTQQKQHPTRPQDSYPTPPPSPDLEQLPALANLPPTSSELAPCPQEKTLAQQSGSPHSRLYQQHRTTPAIPISLLLNTPHALPHGAPFRLTQPSGILSVLGGNRTLHIEGTGSIFDRMPYSPATRRVPLTRDQAEEENVEAMLGNASTAAAPMSPDQTRVSSIFIHPPTPDREERLGDHLSGLPTRSISRDASDRASPSASPIGSPLVGVQSSANAMPLPIQVLPEVRSPPRRVLEMATDSLRIAQNRGRRPKLFGFTELPDSSGSSAASSRAPSPDRTSMAVTQSEAPSSSSLGPATSSPGNFLPRRSPVRARSETSLSTLSTIIHSASASGSGSVSPQRRVSALSNGHRPGPSPPHVAVTSASDGERRPGRRDTGLKLDFSGIIPLNSVGSSGPHSASVHSPYSARLIRKKSGEILKPALKYGGPLAANGTPLEVPPKPLAHIQAQASPARFTSKSAPTTPSCPKYVHFDSQLERVKLFQKEQKPSVVSRNGSPTGDYTTSEGEEYPFPSTDDEGDRRDQKVLQIKLPNFPTSQPHDSELFLESLFLDDDRKSLRGVVQVKNISFQKWVAVRFTLDWWQTTSEVTATHKDSVREGSYDRFSFQIKLHDLLPKIEEKTLFLALRYNTDGREIWDSNDGQNYQVLFEKVKPAPARLVPKRGSLSIQPGMGKAIGGRTSQWSVTSGEDDDRLADLREKLDRLQADDYGLSPPQLSPASTRHTSFSPQRKLLSFAGPSSGSPRRTVSALDARPESDLPAAGPSFGARYDFGVALKTARRNSNSPNKGTSDLPEVRTGLLKYGANGNGNGLPVERGRPTMDFYSPRSEYANLPAGGGFFSPPAGPQPLSSTSTGSSATPTQSTITTPSTAAAPGVRDHSISQPLVKDHSVSNNSVQDHSVSQPTQNSSSSNSTRDHSVSNMNVVVPNLQVQSPSPEPSPSSEEPGSTGTSSSTVSPPNLDPSTESTTDDTPSESPRSPPETALPSWSPTVDRGEELPGMLNYASLIEQFCWGGGPSTSTATHLDRPALERRAHSTTSLDAYFQQNGASSSQHSSTPNGTRPGSGSYFAVTPSPSQLNPNHGPAHSHSHSIDSSPSGSYFSSFSSTANGESSNAQASSANGESAIGLDFTPQGGLEMNMNSRRTMSPSPVY